MNTTNGTDLKSLRETFIDSIADYVSGVGNITRSNIFSLAAALYKNPAIKQDRNLQQCVSFIYFLSGQIKIGNKDILNHDLIEQMFTYILRKLVIRSGYNISLLNK